MKRSFRPFSAVLERQWSFFQNHCGEWHGNWQRFGVDAGGMLSKAAHFEAVCKPTPSAGGTAVRWVNRYTPGFQPPRPAGVLVDGMHEVDFGEFDRSNFQRPFGPHSAALYLPSSCVIGPASVAAAAKAGMLAVELSITLPSDDGQPRHRRRLVAIWRGGDGSGMQLSGVTSIAEVDRSEARGGTADHGARGATPPRVPDECAATGGTLPHEGSPVRRVVSAEALRCGGEPTEFVAGARLPPDYTLPGQMAAWLPGELSPECPETVQISFGWQWSAEESHRVTAVYDGGRFAGAYEEKLGAE